MKRAMLILLIVCLMPIAARAEAGLYADSIRNADVLIEIPALRQYGGYTCGTTCVQMLMNWLLPYEADINLAAYEEELGTTEEAGTSPAQILEYFETSGVNAMASDGWSADDLRAALDRGNPVLMCIQAWSASGDYNTSDPSKPETYLAEGHWVICVGYRKTAGECAFYFNDPACVGHCVMREEDLNVRWIDMDANGAVYDHYGIQIAGETEYKSDGVFRLE